MTDTKGSIISQKTQEKFLGLMLSSDGKLYLKNRILRYPDAFGNYDYTLFNSGKSDASSRSDMQTQTLSAHFPMIFHKNPKKVMILGLASGITAGEILHYPVDQLDILEISDQVVEGSDFFRFRNNDTERR